MASEFNLSDFVESLYSWAIKHKYLNSNKVNKNDLTIKTSKYICYQSHNKAKAIELFPNAKNPVIVATIIKLWFPEIYVSILNKESTAEDYNDIDQIIDDLWKCQSSGS